MRPRSRVLGSSSRFQPVGHRGSRIMKKTVAPQPVFGRDQGGWTWLLLILGWLSVGGSSSWSGLAALAQWSSGPAAVDSTVAESKVEWRRTQYGWEQAQSLSILRRDGDAWESLMPPRPRATAHSALFWFHRHLVPVAIGGFLACFGPWCLLRWPSPPPSPPTGADHRSASSTGRPSSPPAAG
jgi:hypothetical protein